MTYRRRTSSTSTSRWGRRYPWNQWFAQGTFSLVRGTHYNGRTDTMMMQVRQQATKRKLKVTLSASADSTSILVVVWQEGGTA